MDKQTWQQQLKERAGQFKAWLAQRANQDAPYLVYGGLMASTLWPLIDAVTQAGSAGPAWFALGNALRSAAGGVGAGLIANQMEAWKDRAETLTEDDVAGWVVEKAETNPELRDTFNTLLIELNALQQVTPALSEPDKVWLAQTLRQELAQLGAPANTIETLLGSGNLIIQGSTLTGGERSVVGSNAGRDIHTGDNLTVQNIEQQIVQGQVGPEAGSLLADYVNTLFEACRQLPLSQLDKTATGEIEAALNLSSVYTALLTSSPKWQEKEGRLPRGVEGHVLESKEQRSALELLNDEKYLVLLGDPGSGKTTFVNFVASCLAGEQLKKDEANLERLTAPLPDDEGRDEAERQPWQHPALLPVQIILREFAARGLPSEGQPAAAQQLWAFITEELATAKLEAFAPLLEKHLREQGGLLLLDGLDEVPEAHQRREQLKQVIESFRRSFSKCRILVTCRVYAYQNKAWQLANFAEATLAPFSRGQIIRFVERWYDQVVTPQRGLTEAEAQTRAELLKRAIFSRPRLHDLAQRPLLLALMAQLHAYGQGSLPERRERLYGEMVELLLDRWERPKLRRTDAGQFTLEQPALTQWLGVDQERVLHFLEKLAFEIHRDQPEQSDTADITQTELVRGLLELSQTRSERFDMWEMIEYLEGRAGLLVPQGEAVYRFPHRTIQEYLAACHLVNETYPDPLCDLARSDPNRWREVALLAAANAGRQTIWGLVEALCWQTPPDAEAVLPDVWGAHLAAQALVEVADLRNVPERHADKLRRVKDWLVYILEQSALPAIERAIAGRNLAALGDPRPGVLTVVGMEFCYVPPGPFMMGSSDKDEMVRDNEKPLHEVDIPYGYWLGRFPVTVAQFQEFVAQSGHQPQDEDSLRDPLNQPVRYVTWYEAVAFCEWLTNRWQQAEALPVGWQVRLPSEAEWEKAARGGLKLPPEPLIGALADIDLEGFENLPGLMVPNDGRPRRYPWGNEPDPDKANYGDTKIGGTTAVGCFGQGRSLYGCEEMSGNVWEWTRSHFKDYPYNPTDGREDLEAGDNVHRVLRGGAFRSSLQLVRCAFRYGGSPYYWFSNIGFRLVVSPFTSGL